MFLPILITRSRRGSGSFSKASKFSVSVGDYFFAHAGARPGIALNRQSNRDLL